MKKITIILTVLIAMTIKLNAQIPNSGFENWTIVGSYENPTGWSTMNPYCRGPFYSCTKSTDHYPASVGNYSIRIESNTSLTQYNGGFGIAETYPMTTNILPTFPIVGHPNSLCGYYKYNSLNNDSLTIAILLFENGTNVGSFGFNTKISASTWTPFTFPLTYTSADSATIFISAYSLHKTTATSPKGNSVLYVDNLNFDNFITSVTEQTTKNNITLYPNPASDIVTLNIDNSNNDDLTLNIYNVTGTLVKSEVLKQNQRQVNIGDLCNSIYMVEIKSKKWTEEQKLLIQR